MTISNEIFHNVFSGLPMGQEGERTQIVHIVNKNDRELMNIQPTARGIKLQSVYYLKVEGVLAASCTCCSELPEVKQPILIYPYMVVDTFQKPANWQPEQMPTVNLNINLSA